MHKIRKRIMILDLGELHSVFNNKYYQTSLKVSLPWVHGSSTSYK